MKSLALIVTILMAVPTLAFAQGAAPSAAPDAGSLSDKVMQDDPGTKGGTTATPTAKPTDGSISTKVMKDLPGTKGGTTSTPTEKPDDGVSEKVKKDEGKN